MECVLWCLNIKGPYWLLMSLTRVDIFTLCWFCCTLDGFQFNILSMGFQQMSVPVSEYDFKIHRKRERGGEKKRNREL